MSNAVFSAPRERNVLPDLREHLVATADRRAQSSERRFLGTLPPKRSAAVVATAAVALVAGIAIGSKSTDDSTTRDVARTTQPASRVATSTEQAQMEFAVFRSPESSAAAEPSLFGPADLDDPDLEFNVADARQLAIPGSTVWTAPVLLRGTPSICLRLRSKLTTNGVVGGCRPTRLVEDDGLWVSSQAAPTTPNADVTEYAGLVPDGVDKVTFELADGSTSDVLASDNAVTAEFAASRKPRLVRFRNGEGREFQTRF